MKHSIILAVIISTVVAGGLGFFGGMKYQQKKLLSFAGGRTGGGNAAFGQGRGVGGQNQRGMFRPVTGEILSSDEKSITVKLADGGSKIVFLSEKTAINKAQEATVTDLTVGQKVAIFGSENADGSITAQNIQLNPLQMGMRSNLDASPAANMQPLR